MDEIARRAVARAVSVTPRKSWLRRQWFAWDAARSYVWWPGGRPHTLEHTPPSVRAAAWADVVLSPLWVALIAPFFVLGFCLLAVNLVGAGAGWLLERLHLLVVGASPITRAVVAIKRRRRRGDET